MENKTLPVLLLTGYLGSGKTTLLNRILNNKQGIKFAVIVNDIGEVNIDAHLIQRGGVVSQTNDSLVALQNGCICCTLQMDLVEQLCNIERTKRFDYIVIEASGICEPAPIAQTICSIPTLGPKYAAHSNIRLDCVVTVVDALRMQSEFAGGHDLLKPGLQEDDIENLVIQQIEFCNMVLLNKAAGLQPQELGDLKQVVRALQPHAEMVECNYGDVDLDKILHTGLFQFDKVATSAAWIEAIEGRHHEDEEGEAHEEHEEHEHDHHEEHDHDHGEHEEHEHEHEHEEHGHHHHHHHHDGGEVEEYGVGTYVWYQRAPMDMPRFDEFVARRWPKNIIRAKGICYFRSEYDTCYVFEQAGRQVSLNNAGQWYATMSEEELADLLKREPQVADDWDNTYGDRMQKIVFIGRNLDKKALKRELDSCLLP